MIHTSEHNSSDKRNEFTFQKHSEIQSPYIDKDKDTFGDLNPDFHHYQSASDLLFMRKWNSVHWSWKNDLNWIKNAKRNIKDFQDLKLINHSLSIRLEKEQQNVLEEQNKNKNLVKDIERLKFEVKKLNHLNDQMKKSLSINNYHEEIQKIVNELSGLMLSSNKNLNLTDKQKSIIKLLFGDIATKAYKEKINIIEDSLKSRIQKLVVLKEELRMLMGSYLDDIQKFDKNNNIYH